MVIWYSINIKIYGEIVCVYIQGRWIASTVWYDNYVHWEVGRLERMEAATELRRQQRKDDFLLWAIRCVIFSLVNPPHLPSVVPSMLPSILTLHIYPPYWPSMLPSIFPPYLPSKFSPHIDSFYWHSILIFCMELLLYGPSILTFVRKCKHQEFTFLQRQKPKPVIPQASSNWTLTLILVPFSLFLSLNH